MMKKKEHGDKARKKIHMNDIVFGSDIVFGPLNPPPKKTIAKVVFLKCMN